jgi:hypothetical protein
MSYLEIMTDDLFCIISYYLFYHIYHLLSILLTITMLLSMYIIVIFNCYNWLLTVYWSRSFFVTDDLFHLQQSFLGRCEGRTKCVGVFVYVCMYVCVYVCVCSDFRATVIRPTQKLEQHSVVRFLIWKNFFPRAY